MKIKFIVCILFLELAAYLPAQNKYDLETCKELALKNNRQVSNSRLQVTASQETKKEAFTNFFPTAGISGLGFTADKGLLSGNTPAISLPLGEATVSVPSMPYSLLKNGVAGSLTLTQPLYVGGKIINGNKLAKLGEEVEKQKVRLTENQVLLQTEDLYWTIISLYEKIQTIQALEEQLNVLQKDVEVAQKAGLVTMNDVLQVKLKINELESARLNTENGIQVAKMALAQLMGVDSEDVSNFEIETPSMQDPALPQTLYVNHRDALNARAEKELLDKNVEASKLQTKIKQGKYLPTVAVGMSYSENNLFDKWDNSVIGFVSVNIPISGWWGGSHAIKKQKIEERMAENARMDGQEQLLIQMQNVRNELDVAYKQILIAKESIEQATENLRINNDQYKTGIVKMSDLLDAQTLLQKSKDNYVDAFAAYQRKQFEYFQVTGR